MVLPGNQKSMNLLRSAGWTVGVVERWLSFGGKGGVRKDLWGFADLIAMKAGEPHLLIQTTTKKQVRPHLRTILNNPDALAWLRTKGRIEIHGWHKVPAGKRLLWQADVLEVTEEMFHAGERE